MIKTGGHSSPISMVDLSEKEKKAQKKRISLLINHPIDHFKDFSISHVWFPSFLSKSTSFPHKYKTINKTIKLNRTKEKDDSFQINKTKVIKNLKEDIPK